MAKEQKQKKHFFKDFKAELKRVIWPTSKQVVNNTIAVIVIVLITAAIVFILDLIFDVFNSYGINKIKARIKSEENAIEITDSAEEKIEEGNLIEEDIQE